MPARARRRHGHASDGPGVPYLADIQPGAPFVTADLPAVVPPPRTTPWRPILAAVAGIALLVVVGRSLAGALTAAVATVQTFGIWAPAVFIGLYIVACVTAVPGSILTLAAGAVFGLAGGVAAAFTGAMLGSAAAFLLARFVMRDTITRRIGADARFAAIDRAVAARGRLIVFLVRLSPAFPFSLLNFAFGITTVRLRDYLLGGLGMLPGTVLYVYYGKLLGEAAVLAGGTAPPKGAAYYAVLALGLAATLAVTVLVTRTARRALAEATHGA